MAAELVAYEYIGRSGIAVKLAPFNGYFWKGVVESGRITRTSGNTTITVSSNDGFGAATLNYIPLWLKYYFLGQDRKVWPNAGIGAGWHIYEQDSDLGSNDSVSGPGGAIQLGLDFGNGVFKRSSANLKIFLPGSGDHDNVLVAITFGFSFGWQ